MRTLLVLMLSIALVSPSFAEGMPKVGDKAPAFEMTGSDGKTYAAKDFEGKQAVIIAWFPRAFTRGCTAECKSMRDSSAMLKEYNVAYFTASTDSVDKNAEFAKSLMLDYPILCDPDGKNAKLFGVLKPDGAVANRVTFVIGQDGKVIAVEEKVQTESHGQDLAKLLEKLGVAKKTK
jgi:thioredoxin-dependent peroxiredoxin